MREGKWWKNYDRNFCIKAFCYKCMNVVERREIHATMRRCTKYDFFLFLNISNTDTQRDRVRERKNERNGITISTADDWYYTHTPCMKEWERKQDKK